jgi:Bacterial PH domain
MSETNFDELIWNKPGLPDKVKSDEDLVLVVREDLVIIVTKAIGLFLVFLTMLAARAILLGYLDKGGIALFDVFLFSINAILILIFSIIFHNYYLSIQIVTSERIIDVDQKGLFNREVNTLSIGNIEDVNYKKSGFWGTLLNFGNVVVQTAGSAGESADGKVSGFVFENVPNPAYISTQVMSLFQKDQQSSLQTAAMLNAQAIKEALR